MPELLTELDQWDEDVYVPLGSELTRAAQLKAIAQQLLNRGRWLRNRVALLASDQTWTGLNTFTKNLTVQDAQLFLRTAGAESAALRFRAPTTDDDWCQRISFDAGGPSGTQRVRIYSGVHGDTLGSLALVLNAEWFQSDHKWHQTDATKKSIALIWRYNNLRLVGVPAGQATWDYWPQDSNIKAFGADIQSEAVRVGRAYAVPNTDADYSNGYRFDANVTRWSPIPLGSLWGNVVINTGGHARRNNAITGEWDQVWIPIRVPPYCLFRSVRVRFLQLQTIHIAPDEFQLMRRVGNAGWIAQGSVETHASFGGETVATLHGGGAETRVLDQHEWAYRWKVVSTDPDALHNRIVGIDLEWVDTGPSNGVG